MTDFSEFAPPPEKTLNAILGMKDSVRSGMDLERKYASVEFTNERGKSLSHSLWRANELFRACVTAAVAGSTVALETVARSLTEELINAQWSSISESNAQLRRASGIVEAHKYMRANLLAGHAHLRDKQTNKRLGRKLTSEFVEKTKPASKDEPSLEQKSRDCGLHRLYSRLFRALSITSHGNDQGFRTPIGKKWEKVEALISVAIALHTALLQSVEHFFIYGEPASSAVLMRTLFPPLS